MSDLDQAKKAGSADTAPPAAGGEHAAGKSSNTASLNGGSPKDSGITAPADDVTPAERAAFFAEVRRQAGNAMSRAFTKFCMASLGVKEELEKKAAAPTLVQQLIELAITTVAPVAANLALGAIRNIAKEAASVTIGKALGNTDNAIKAYDKADKFIDDLKVDAAMAKAGLTALQNGPLTATAGAGPTADGAVPLGGKDPVGGNSVTAAPGTSAVQNVATLLESFRTNMDTYIGNLDSALPSLPERQQVGVLAAFKSFQVTEEFYKQRIRELVKKHETLKGEMDNGDGRQRVVMLSAWGQTQPALLKHTPLSLLGGTVDHWNFVKWIEPEMASTAMAMGAAQPGGLDHAKAGEPYKSSRNLPIMGHIDDPKTEGERLLQVNSWGKLRLCRATYRMGKAEFISWVPEEEEESQKSTASMPIMTVEESVFVKTPPKPAEVYKPAAPAAKPAG